MGKQNNGGGPSKIPGTPEDQNMIRRQAKAKRRNGARVDTSGTSIFHELAADRKALADEARAAATAARQNREREQVAAVMRQPAIQSLQLGSCMELAILTWLDAYLETSPRKGRLMVATEQAKIRVDYSHFTTRKKREFNHGIALAKKTLLEIIYANKASSSAPTRELVSA